MPELPEVETVKNALAPWLTGRTIRLARRVDAPPGPKYAGLERAGGQTIVSVERRGKFLVMPLSGGDEMIVHLGMTGVLSAEPPVDHVRVEVVLAGRADNRLFFRDPRRFGRFVVLGPGGREALPTLNAMGPEPLSEAFTVVGFAEALSGRRSAIKAVLLGQRVVAGVGNIYADEALWRARVHPETHAEVLTRKQVLGLHGAIREVLAEAIADGGTTLRDYRRLDGELGSHQEALGVYGRAGLGCPSCESVLERLVVGQRGTTFCPLCQRRGRLPGAAVKKRTS